MPCWLRPVFELAGKSRLDVHGGLAKPVSSSLSQLRRDAPEWLLFEGIDRAVLHIVRDGQGIHSVKGISHKGEKHPKAALFETLREERAVLILSPRSINGSFRDAEANLRSSLCRL